MKDQPESAPTHKSTSAADATAAMHGTFASIADTIPATIDQMHAAAVKRLKSDDPESRAALDKAFTEYRKCHDQFKWQILLVIQNP